MPNFGKFDLHIPHKDYYYEALGFGGGSEPKGEDRVRAILERENYSEIERWARRFSGSIVSCGTPGPHPGNPGNVATGPYSCAEGEGTTASGEAAHSEGTDGLAIGDFSHTEGQQVEAHGTAAHAEGFETNAQEEYSHAEGQETTSSGVASHAEGNLTQASGDYSHAEGDSASASGVASHAGGGPGGSAYVQYMWCQGSDLSQTGVLPQSAQTFDATPATLSPPLDFIDFSHTVLVKGNVVAHRRSVSGAEESAWDFQTFISGDRSSAYRFVSGVAPTVNLIAQDVGAATYIVAVTLSGTQLVVTVTGAAAKTIMWHCTLEIHEIIRFT